MRAKKVKQRSGYIRLGGSSDFYGYDRSQPIGFENDDDAIRILKAHDVIEDERITVNYVDGVCHTFPVDNWIEWILNDIHEESFNIYGGPDDLYPFLDNNGFIGWISKDIRTSQEDLKEAKRRLYKEE